MKEPFFNLFLIHSRFFFFFLSFYYLLPPSSSSSSLSQSFPLFKRKNKVFRSINICSVEQSINRSSLASRHSTSTQLQLQLNLNFNSTSTQLQFNPIQFMKGFFGTQRIGIVCDVRHSLLWFIHGEEEEDPLLLLG